MPNPSLDFERKAQGLRSIRTSEHDVPEIELTSALQPRRLIIAPAAVGCKRLLAGGPRRKMKSMPKAISDVLADALRLEPAARAEVAAELLASLDGPPDADAEAAWDAEIQRRIEAIETGTARLEPWSEVKRRIERDLLGR
jgi:hypothetical protein